MKVSLPTANATQTIFLLILFLFIHQVKGWNCGDQQCHYRAHCETTGWLWTSSSCICDKGFKGNGLECVDIDECKEKIDQCSANANCRNTEGDYTCHCHSGFVGNGMECTDIDECETMTPCEDHLVCKNTQGSYVCELPINSDEYLYYILISITLIILIFYFACNDDFQISFEIIHNLLHSIVEKTSTIPDDDRQMLDNFIRVHLPNISNLFYQRFTIICFAIFAYFYYWWKYFIIGQTLDRIPLWHKQVVKFSNYFGDHTLWILLLLTNLIYLFIGTWELSRAKLEVICIILEGVISEFNRNRIMYKLFQSKVYASKWRVLLEFLFVEIAPVNLLYDLYFTYDSQFNAFNFDIYNIFSIFDNNYIYYGLFTVSLLILFGFPKSQRKIKSKYSCNALVWCVDISKRIKNYENTLLILENFCIVFSTMYFIVGIFFV